MKFRKKPVVVKAVQWEGDNVDEVNALIAGAGGTVEFYEDYGLVYTLEGLMRANKGDWIILGVAGELYPCKPDIFEATYEKVEG